MQCCLIFREGEEHARGDYADHFAEEGKEEETAQEKRLRLAKQYLTELEEQGHPSLPSVSPPLCFPSPLCPLPSVTPPLCVPSPLCPLPSVSPSLCVPSPLCPLPSVSPPLCVPSPLCPLPSVSPPSVTPPSVPFRLD